MVTFSTGERDEWQETLFGLEGKIPDSLQAAWWPVSEVAAVLGNLGRSRKRQRGCGRRSRGERLRWGGARVPARRRAGLLTAARSEGKAEAFLQKC